LSAADGGLSMGEDRDIQSHLLKLHGAAREVLTESARDQGRGLGRLVVLDLDIGQWERALNHRPEFRQLRDARRELGFAIFAAASGLYRQAYAGLRAFLELSFASVYFSVNELHYRRWVANRQDFSWSKALDPAEGVLSDYFVREFNEAARERAPGYAEQAATCYRHCSEFIHGKLSVSKELPDTLLYSDDALADWLGTGARAAEATLYLLYSRYSAELIPSPDERLEQTLENSFSHLACIRKMRGLPLEKSGQEND
jgi:hypothetical protein